MMSLRIQFLMIMGQGVPEISVRIHTHTNYFSNIDDQFAQSFALFCDTADQYILIE